DGDEVEEDLDGAAEAVLAGAEAARAVVDDDLADAGPAPAAEGGEEAVHLAVEVEPVEDLAPVGLEGAPEVVDGGPGEAGDEAVGDDGGEAAGEEAVLALAAPAADDVEPGRGVEALDEAGGVAGVVLEVGVHGNDVAAAGAAETRGEGGGLAESAGELDDADAGVAAGGLVEALEAGVGAAVVHDDQLPREAGGVHDLGDLGVE